MSLVLTEHDQQLFRTALRTLVSLDADEADRWPREVGGAVKALVRADRCALVYPDGDRAALVSEDYDPDALRPYGEYYRERDLGHARVVTNRLEVFSRRHMFRDDMPTLLRSECYNDYLAPSEMGDSMGMAVHGATPADTALLAFHRQAFGSDDFDERGPALLRMLYPAFERGLRTWLRLRNQVRALHRTIDAVPEAAALYDADGGLLHANRRLLALLAAEPDASGIELTLDAIARDFALLGAGIGDAGIGPAPSSRMLSAGGAHYRVTPTLMNGLHSRAVVLLRLEAGQPALPPTERLRARASLTRREAQVALLLAERRTNAEVAAALVISPHTARHHTEKVLGKLGVRSRHAVREALLRLG